MTEIDVVRAWKDPVYRASLGDAAPPHPCGAVELTDEQLQEVSGLATIPPMTTAMTCTEYTWRSWKACCPK